MCRVAIVRIGSEELVLSIDSVMSRLNPAICAVLRSRFHWLLSRGLMLVTVTGRKSGRQYTIPVGYQFEQPFEQPPDQDPDPSQWPYA